MKRFTIDIADEDIDAQEALRNHLRDTGFRFDSTNRTFRKTHFKKWKSGHKYANVFMFKFRDMAFRFGQYTDVSLDEVLEKNPQYVLWCEENVPFVTFSEDILQEAYERKHGTFKKKEKEKAYKNPFEDFNKKYARSEHWKDADSNHWKNETDQKTRFSSDALKVLGLALGATWEQIKATYRKLALQYHPDVNKSHDAEERMKNINAAYSILQEEQRI